VASFRLFNLTTAGILSAGGGKLALLSLHAKAASLDRILIQNSQLAFLHLAQETWDMETLAISNLEVKDCLIISFPFMLFDTFSKAIDPQISIVNVTSTRNVFMQNAAFISVKLRT